MWLRGVIGLLATISVVGYGLAWNTLGKNLGIADPAGSGEQELNSHLKDPEPGCRRSGAWKRANPLNIVRGIGANDFQAAGRLALNPPQDQVNH